MIFFDGMMSDLINRNPQHGKYEDILNLRFLAQNRKKRQKYLTWIMQDD